MRLIKFRAWDSRNRTMQSADVLDSEWEEIAFNFQDAQYVMMQFTGLLDKNDKEIYEGDIVELYNHKGDVYYEKNCFLVRGYWMGSQDDPGDAFESLEAMEVIGNIYEHPNLLES